MADNSKDSNDKKRGKKQWGKQGVPAPEPDSIGIFPMPRSLEAESGVLGAMLLDNGIIPEVVQRVTADEFYLAAHKIVFRSITEIADRGQPVDLPLLIEELKKKDLLEEAGGIPALASMEMQVFSTGAAPEWAEQISQKATLRSLMKASERILRECAEQSLDVESQVDIAEKLIFDISQKTAVNEFVHVEEIMQEALAKIALLKNQSGATTGVSTGYIDLDGYLNGFHAGDLLILAARPSIGKTAFALNLMVNIATKTNTPVAIFSLEMGKEQLLQRILCAYARVSMGAVSSGKIKESEYLKLVAKGEELAGFPILIDDTPAGLSIMQLRSKARRMKIQYPNLGLVIIDYLQLMSGSDRSGRESRQQEVSEISRGLKALARELEVPVLALSQLSRNIESRSGKDKGARPMLSDLRESGAIEQDADIVMFVHRERVETQKDGEGRPVDKGIPIETEIIIGKHRNGAIGTVKLAFHADQTLFTNFQA